MSQRTQKSSCSACEAAKYSASNVLRAMEGCFLTPIGFDNQKGCGWFLWRVLDRGRRKNKHHRM